MIEVKVVVEENGKAKEGRKIKNKIEGSPNDPLYVSKLTYYIVISLQEAMLERWIIT